MRKSRESSDLRITVLLIARPVDLRSEDFVFVCSNVNALHIPVSVFRRELFLNLSSERLGFFDYLTLVLRLLRFLLGDEQVVLLLLERSQRLVALLELHRLEDIFALGEPENQVITLSQALFGAAGLVVQGRQLVGPFLDVLDLLELLQSLDLLIERHALGLLDLVAQHILVRILRSEIDVLFIAVLSLVRIAELESQSPEPVDDLAAVRPAVVGKEQNLSASLIVSVILIDFTDFAKHQDILYVLPIDAVGNLHGLSVILVVHVLEHFLGFYLIFVFIQYPSPRLVHSKQRFQFIIPHYSMSKTALPRERPTKCR